MDIDSNNIYFFEVEGSPKSFNIPSTFLKKRLWMEK